MSLIIRPATAADREFLLSMAARLADFDELPAGRSAGEIVEGDARELVKALADPPAASALLVAELDGVPAGCLHLVTRTDFFSRAVHGHISVIAVAKDVEGRGVGRALMEHADGWARQLGYPHVTLGVFPGNARARALYERHGYGVDLLIMRREME